MIQAGRNGIIFHSCHAAFPFLHLSLSFGCAISFCKKQPFVKSSVRFSEKQGSFLFPFCPLFFLPDGNMAVPRYPVPPFVATSLIFPSAVPQPVVSSVFCLQPPQFSPTELHENTCRFCGLTAETHTIVPVDGLHFHFPCNYGFPLIFRIVFRRSHHHFPMQRQYADGNDFGSLDQWRSRTIFLYRAFRFCLRTKIKSIDASGLGASP